MIESIRKSKHPSRLKFQELHRNREVMAIGVGRGGDGGGGGIKS